MYILEKITLNTGISNRFVGVYTGLMKALSKVLLPGNKESYGC